MIGKRKLCSYASRYTTTSSSCYHYNPGHLLTSYIYCTKFGLYCVKGMGLLFMLLQSVSTDRKLICIQV